MEVKLGLCLLAMAVIGVSLSAFPPGKHQAIGLVLGSLALLATIAVAILDKVRDME